MDLAWFSPRLFSVELGFGLSCLQFSPGPCEEPSVARAETPSVKLDTDLPRLDPEAYDWAK